MIRLLKKLHVKKYDYLYLILLTIISSLIIFSKITSSFRMFSGYNYDSDFGRDLLRMYEILHGKFTLIGPQLSFAGLHMAPYSYYLFAPFLFLSNFDHRALFFANGSLFMIEFFILFLLLKNRWGKNYSFLSILWLITTPYIILSSRSPGNAFSYIIFLFFIFYILFYKKNISTKLHFIIGVIEGLIINFHPINILITTPLHIGIIAMQKPESFMQKVKKITISLIGTGLTFLPIALFEIKHNFVITKNLLNPSNYLKYLGTSGLGFSNLIISFIDLNKITSSLISISMFGLLIINCLLLAKSKKNIKFILFFAISLLNTLFLYLFKQGAVHYFFPTLLMLQVTLLFMNNKSKYKNVLMIALIGINIVFFPIRFYQPARNLMSIENSFKIITRNNFLPLQNLNVILINETPLSKVGYEYRFLLNKYNYSVNDEYSYIQSRYLLVIDEKSIINDFKNEQSWEFKQFGNKKLLHKNIIDKTTFYLFEKQ